MGKTGQVEMNDGGEVVVGRPLSISIKHAGFNDLTSIINLRLKVFYPYVSLNLSHITIIVVMMLLPDDHM